MIFSNSERKYEKGSPEERIVNTTFRMGGFGLLFSTYLNATQTHNKGVLGIFTRTGAEIPYFGKLFTLF